MTPTDIKDADPEAWKGDRRPEPTPEQTRLFRACADLIAAKGSMAKHSGAYSGPDWEAKVQRHRGAWEAFEAVFSEIKGRAT